MKLDDRIPILQLTRSRDKSQKKTRYESKKMVLNQAQDSKKSLENNAHILEWRHLYHLNCDRLVYMHHTPNLLAKNQKIEFHLIMI